MIAAEATDLWAVGAMAFEILCGRSLYPPNMGEHEIIGALLGCVSSGVFGLCLGFMGCRLSPPTGGSMRPLEPCSGKSAAGS